MGVPGGTWLETGRRATKINGKVVGDKTIYWIRTAEKPLLQLTDNKDETTIIPLTEDQREKFKEQDTARRDLAAVNDLLSRTLGLDATEAA